jgi:hypothetical protein
MSNTDALKKTEANLVPPGFEIDHVFDIQIGDYHGTAEVDGFDPVSREAVEIYQTDTRSPKSGQRRKLAADVLKLVFLKDLGLITRGRVFVTSRELYSWCHESGSWLNAARMKYGIQVELKSLPKIHRRKVRNALSRARREMRDKE